MEYKSCLEPETKILSDEDGTIQHNISVHLVDDAGHVVWLPGYKIAHSLAVLEDHGWCQRGRRPIGGNTKLELIGGNLDAKLSAVTKFAMFDPESALLFRLHKEGFLKGWSIGYIPGKRLFDYEAREFLKKNGWPEDRVENVYQVHLDIEIKEYSSTAIPANPGAVDGLSNEQLIEVVKSSTIVQGLEKQLASLRERIEVLEGNQAVQDGETPDEEIKTPFEILRMH